MAKKKPVRKKSSFKTEDSLFVVWMVAVITLLALIFLAVAYWRYG